MMRDIEGLLREQGEARRRLGEDIGHDCIFPKGLPATAFHIVPGQVFMIAAAKHVERPFGLVTIWLPTEPLHSFLGLLHLSWQRLCWSQRRYSIER